MIPQTGNHISIGKSLPLLHHNTFEYSSHSAVIDNVSKFRESIAKGQNFSVMSRVSEFKPDLMDLVQLLADKNVEVLILAVHLGIEK